MIRPIVNSQYTVADPSRENLKSLKFHEVDRGLFSRRFPVYKWDGVTVLEGEFLIYEDDKNVRVNLYTMDGKIYPPFYDGKQSTLENNSVLLECSFRILRMMSQYGIKKKVIHIVRHKSVH